MAKVVFSVRSAYYIQKEREMANKAKGSSSARNNSIWRSIWQLKIPNVEKHLLWRACHDILPTRVKLCDQKALTDPICPVYERELETIFHTLWQCPTAGDVCTIFQKSWFEGPDFLQVIEGLFCKCDQMEFSQFLSIARRIWLQWNEVVHGGSFSHSNNIVQQAPQATEVFTSLLVRVKIEREPTRESSVNKWKAPPWDGSKPTGTPVWTEKRGVWGSE
ncbi:uncharacterized protein LOC132185130 [Corylus avellana]|uniref:uncharacterized protein LOC132185130 n=1 Tax=Corylus avellana TaxID=13451 RepID=UPI00286A7924|nr:uncharacterized protein LOC132185130 [Corylus avellana]